ncbi:MAG TPA: hypothetical protein VHK88_17290 [Aquihabitans sp.]|jgi:hypothetical protein|nr:hypothetical protein [Aquihabitans sp.]
MASSSSAKKVARVAARSGGGAKAGKQAAWIFPVAIGLIVVLGIGVVVYARSENAGGNDNSTPPRAQLAEGEPFDHWHAAFSINACGKEEPPPNDVEADLLGIHTHGDGLIHIHPFATRASGRNATLKRFFDQVGLKVTDEGFETADGRVFKEGETTCGGEPAELILAHWEDARTAGSSEPDQIVTEDFPSVRLSEDLGAYTLAFVPEGDREVPAPSASAQIEELGAADGGTTQSDAPESQDPSATVPEGSTPEGSTPEGSTPEGTTPEGSTPEEGAATTAPASSTPTTAAAGG